MTKQEVVDAISEHYLSSTGNTEDLIRDNWDRGYYTAVESVINYILEEIEWS